MICASHACVLIQFVFNMLTYTCSFIRLILKRFFRIIKTGSDILGGSSPLIDKIVFHFIKLHINCRKLKNSADHEKYRTRRLSGEYKIYNVTSVVFGSVQYFLYCVTEY